VIRHHRKVPGQADAWKNANGNEPQRIMGPRWAVRAGLKILVSAVQSRSRPPFFLATCPPKNFSQSEVVPNSGTLQRIPAREDLIGGVPSNTVRGSSPLLRVAAASKVSPGEASS